MTETFPFLVRCVNDGAFFSVDENDTIVPPRPGDKTCLTKGKTYEVLGINKTFGWYVLVDDSKQGTYMYPPSRFVRV